MIFEKNQSNLVLETNPNSQPQARANAGIIKYIRIYQKCQDIYALFKADSKKFLDSFYAPVTIKAQAVFREIEKYFLRILRYIS